jgi:cellulose synthase/poly-beta-1,6-N-acetylglucosamine synthase-like glycosyltransferase
VGENNVPRESALSVIIPAYNAEKTLYSCLSALYDQSLPKRDYEIVVVDDGSTDGTSKIAKDFNVNYLFQTNQGPATARNKGVHAARGNIVLFTDSDCIPEHNWIKEMVRPFGDPDVVGVKGTYKTTQTDLAARFAQAEFEDRYDLLKKNPSIDMIDTYSAAFKKDIFLQIGGFDQNFPVANNEDTDLSYRLATAGYKLVFNPAASVYHSHPDTFIKYLKLKFWRGYWRMIVYRRYPNKAMKDSYTPATIKIQTMLMALSLPLFLLSLFTAHFIYLALLLWAVIMVSAIPFSIKTSKKDILVGIISPLVVLLRSFVFAIGSVWGIIRSIF